jgi:hypothetical protein
MTDDRRPHTTTKGNAMTTDWDRYCAHACQCCKGVGYPCCADLGCGRDHEAGEPRENAFPPRLTVVAGLGPPAA